MVLLVKRDFLSLLENIQICVRLCVFADCKNKIRKYVGSSLNHPIVHKGMYASEQGCDDSGRDYFVTRLD